MAYDLPLTLSPLDVGEFPRKELSLSSRKILLAFFFFFFYYKAQFWTLASYKLFSWISNPAR